MKDDQSTKDESTPSGGDVGLRPLVRCSICERQFPSEQIKDADDFAPQGNHRYLQICEECEADFDKLDITFNFSANVPALAQSGERKLNRRNQTHESKSTQ